MARSTWSLKVKASVAAAALFLAGLATAGALSYLAMNKVAEQSFENQTSRAVEEALETLKEVRTRMAGYASILARNPTWWQLSGAGIPRCSRLFSSASSKP